VIKMFISHSVNKDHSLKNTYKTNQTDGVKNTNV
jgi:hypothetical protein